MVAVTAKPIATVAFVTELTTAIGWPPVQVEIALDLASAEEDIRERFHRVFDFHQRTRRLATPVQIDDSGTGKVGES